MADTPTEVARQAFFHFLFRGKWVLMKKRFGTHDRAGRAESALKSGMIDECLLERIHFPRFGITQPFNRRDMLPIALNRQRHTGEDSLAIHEHGAAPTSAVIAGNLCAGKAQGFPERVSQRVSRIDLMRSPSNLQLNGLPVDREAEAIPPR